MYRQNPKNNYQAWVIRLGIGLATLSLGGLGTWPQPGRSHQVEIADDVGGTLHIEPNDRPRVGQSHLTWFALTQRGGQVIPLADCDCALAIYAGAYTPDRAPLSTARLTASSAEPYQGIPAATLVFPTVGQYHLVLQGKPLGNGTFQPCPLIFPVTVTR